MKKQSETPLESSVTQTLERCMASLEHYRKAEEAWRRGKETEDGELDQIQNALDDLGIELKMTS